MSKRVVRIKKKRKPLPKNPSYTSPTSVRKNPDGTHVIPRFIITENGKKNVVVDMETGDLAEKTSSTGYTFKEARRIAKWFRENKGLYTTMPF